MTTQAIASAPVWAIVRSYNKWYHVARIIHVDGSWFELYWHPDMSTRGPSKEAIRKVWREYGTTRKLHKNIFEDTPSPRVGSTVQPIGK